MNKFRSKIMWFEPSQIKITFLSMLLVEGIYSELCGETLVHLQASLPNVLPYEDW